MAALHFARAESARTAAVKNSAAPLVVGAPPAVVVPPRTSWEAWILELRAGRLRDRPDHAALGSPLPLWVDCHLSWNIDRAGDSSPSSAVRGAAANSATSAAAAASAPPAVTPAMARAMAKLVLRAKPALCQGQPEEWSPSPTPPPRAVPSNNP